MRCKKEPQREIAPRPPPAHIKAAGRRPGSWARASRPRAVDVQPRSGEIEICKPSLRASTASQSIEFGAYSISNEHPAKEVAFLRALLESLPKPRFGENGGPLDEDFLLYALRNLLRVLVSNREPPPQWALDILAKRDAATQG